MSDVTMPSEADLRRGLFVAMASVEWGGPTRRQIADYVFLAWPSAVQISRRDALVLTGRKRPSIDEAFTWLRERRILICDDPGRGQRPASWRLNHDPSMWTCSWSGRFGQHDALALFADTRDGRLDTVHQGTIGLDEVDIDVVAWQTRPQPDLAARATRPQGFVAAWATRPQNGRRPGLVAWATRPQTSESGVGSDGPPGHNENLWPGPPGHKSPEGRSSSSSTPDVESSAATRGAPGDLEERAAEVDHHQLKDAIGAVCARCAPAPGRRAPAVYGVTKKLLAWAVVVYGLDQVLDGCKALGTTTSGAQAPAYVDDLLAWLAAQATDTADDPVAEPEPAKDPDLVKAERLEAQAAQWDPDDPVHEQLVAEARELRNVAGACDDETSA